MKTYEEAIEWESSIMLRDYFHVEMTGGKGTLSVEPNVSEIVGFIYGKNSLVSRSEILHLFERKLKDLKENWEKAVHGEYDFFYFYKEEKIFFKKVLDN